MYRRKLKMCSSDMWMNLGEEKAFEMMNELIAKGVSEDDAFIEVYSIECNMDHDDEEEIY
jgi:hypothetical protein